MSSCRPDTFFNICNVLVSEENQFNPNCLWDNIGSTCYTAGGMPLAFTQEDFLVLIYFFDNRAQIIQMENMPTATDDKLPVPQLSDVWSAVLVGGLNLETDLCVMYTYR